MELGGLRVRAMRDTPVRLSGDRQRLGMNQNKGAARLAPSTVRTPENSVGEERRGQDFTYLQESRKGELNERN
jgi:hypothetical protein